MSGNIKDDKSPIVVPFILSRISEHRRQHGTRPFFIGLNGVQGAGKTTLVAALQRTLSNPPHSLATLCFSIDDLYLPREEQQRLTEAHSGNPLLAQRGQPGTHDVSFGLRLFSALRRAERDVKIPSYDKSAYNGKGDRIEERLWETWNGQDESKIEVVLFEGWCVGFRPLAKKDLTAKWEKACEELHGPDEKHSSCSDSTSPGRLGRQRLQDVRTVNESLRSYDELTDQLDILIHLDARDSQYVYKWRLEQEAALRASKGKGMNESEVMTFVNGYYPAYELYTDGLRAGIFGMVEGKQLRLTLDQERKVVKHDII